MPEERLYEIVIESRPGQIGTGAIARLTEEQADFVKKILDEAKEAMVIADFDFQGLQVLSFEKIREWFGELGI